MAFTLKSNTIADGGEIPLQYTCEQNAISPPLHWDDPPAGTQSFALVIDDPDAPHGVFTHWLLYHLPADARAIPENVIPGAEGPQGSAQGRNSAGEQGYMGPCPPLNATHRYVFSLYALNSDVELPAGATKAELVGEMAERIIAVAQLTGRFTRHEPAWDSVETP